MHKLSQHSSNQDVIYFYLERSRKIINLKAVDRKNGFVLSKWMWRSANTNYAHNNIFSFTFLHESLLVIELATELLHLFAKPKEA